MKTFNTDEVQERTIYTAETAAKILGCSARTLYFWQDWGWLPKATYFDGRQLLAAIQRRNKKAYRGSKGVIKTRE